MSEWPGQIMDSEYRKSWNAAFRKKKKPYYEVKRMADKFYKYFTYSIDYCAGEGFHKIGNNYYWVTSNKNVYEYTLKQ